MNAKQLENADEAWIKSEAGKSSEKRIQHKVQKEAGMDKESGISKLPTKYAWYIFITIHRTFLKQILSKTSGN